MCECGLETLDGLKGFEFESLEVLVLYGNEIEEVESTFMCCRSDDEEEEDGGKKEGEKAAVSELEAFNAERKQNTGDW